MTDLLRTELQLLARKLQPAGVTLTVAGGYGLLLRVNAIAASGARTLGGFVPTSRSTADIDVHLGYEVITSGEKARHVRTAISELGYEPTTKYLIFAKTIDLMGTPVTLTIDLLASPVPEEDRHLVSSRNGSERIRPTEYDQLHARMTPEAVFVESHPQAVDVSDDASGVFVHLPTAFAYLTLKLFAFRDGPTSKEPDKADRHALDLFTIWATTTEPEWELARLLRDTNQDHPILLEARVIVTTLFSGDAASALLAVQDAARKNGQNIERGQLLAFQRDLIELLG